MVLASKIVLYHHNVFLLFPRMLVLCHKSRVGLSLGVGLILLMQSDRLFEVMVIRVPFPVDKAQLLLMGIVLYRYFQALRPAPPGITISAGA